jgi:hypothetical protein
MSALDLTFPHAWTAVILPQRPPILPPRHYTYPRAVEEVERGALEVRIRPESGPNATAEPPSSQPFLATFALGFADPLAPTGVWACPDPQWLCAVAGGYAYLLDTAQPEVFTQIPYRPVLQVVAAEAAGLLLFVGHHSILAWGRQGRAWESARLSWEGIRIAALDAQELRGYGWNLMEDREFPFVLDLDNGAHRIGE